MRASSPPVPKDVERRAENRAHAKAYKERKDAEEARCKRKSLERDELEKRRRQQRHDGLPKEPSPSPSSTDSSSDDDESEAGRGPLDHLPDVRGMMLGVSASGLVSPGLGGEDASGLADTPEARALASGLASLGGGGEDASGLATARPRAEADTPEAQALGKRAVSPVGSTAKVEQAVAGATQLSL